MSNVGLYLGTFNPIHNGHVTLAEYFSKLPELDEVLVVISPQSPFKKEIELINGRHSLQVHTIVHQIPSRLTPVKGLSLTILAFK